MGVSEGDVEELGVDGASGLGRGTQDLLFGDEGHAEGKAAVLEEVGGLEERERLTSIHFTSVGYGKRSIGVWETG